MRLLLSLWSSSDMNFQPLGWLNTTCTIVTCSGLWLWDLWDIYEWYCYFIAKLYWEAWGLFWKRSVSLFLRGVLFRVGCLLVFLLGLFGFCSCCLFVLVAAFWLDGRHLRYRFTLFSCVGMDNLNQWIDDRQSFERARHPQKKKMAGSANRCFSLVIYTELIQSLFEVSMKTDLWENIISKWGFQGHSVLLHFSNNGRAHQAVLVSMSSAPSKSKKREHAMWKHVLPVSTDFAWLPEDVADAFCSLALHQDSARPYGSFHEVQLGFNEHYQALLRIEGLYYLGETRSVDEFNIFSQMPAERLCLGCGVRLMSGLVSCRHRTGENYLGKTICCYPTTHAASVDWQAPGCYWWWGAD